MKIRLLIAYFIFLLVTALLPAQKANDYTLTLTKLTHFRDLRKIPDLQEVKKISESVKSLDDMQPDWKTEKFIKLKCLFVAIDIAARGLDKKTDSLNRQLELRNQIASLQNCAQLFVRQHIDEEEKSQVETIVHETIVDEELSCSTAECIFRGSSAKEMPFVEAFCEQFPGEDACDLR